MKASRIGLWIFAALALLGATLSGARAAPPDVGALTPQGCVDDNDTGADSCAQSTEGLFASRAVAVSPDGTSVYAASGDDAVVHLSRDPTTGALTPQGCVDDNDTGTDDCAQSTNGLGAGPESVAVSPDGTSVYVASTGDDAVVGFARNPATGALTPQGCVDDNDPPDGADDCAQSTDGLGGARGVAVSADGASVYVASSGDEAVVHLNRNPATGALTPQGCVQDNDTGTDACAQMTDGLAGARGVTVSPDGASVYVASGGGFDNAVVRFDRSIAGALTPQGCIDDNDPGQGPDACAQSTDGLAGAQSVAVSPDGASVYAVSASDNAIVRFDRSTAGALTPQGCVEDNDVGPDACAQSTDGLDDARGVAVSPDGISVYVASADDEAVARFDRSTTGALNPRGCVDDNDTGADTCAQSTDGLATATAVAVSPGAGTSVYVAADGDDSVVRFDRVPLDTDPPQTKITKKPKKKTIKRKARFAFISDEPDSTFECKLDKKPFKPCTSPKKVKVKPGRHRFQVRATDESGNTDPTPARHKWKVEEK